MAESSYHMFYKRIMYERINNYLQNININMFEMNRDYELYLEPPERGLYTKKYPLKNLNGYIPDFFFFF